MTYTIKDVKDIFPQPLTPNQENGVLNFLNKGVIPPVDPCQGCEPNTIRSLIGEVRLLQRQGKYLPKADGRLDNILEEAGRTPEETAEWIQESLSESTRVIATGGRDDLEGLEEVISEKAPAKPSPKRKK